MSACNGLATVGLVKSLVVGGGGLSGFTPEGGLYVTYTNNTGTASVKGTVVVASTTINRAVSIAPANSDMPIGVIYDNGVANGQPVKVIVCGNAETLLKNGQAASRGFWCGVADVAGRMHQQSSPPSTTEHSREVGHCLQTVAAGVDKLALIGVHFN